MAVAYPNQIPVIAPQTAAVTTNPFPTDQYDTVVVSADNLTGGETINIQALAGATVVQVLKLDGTNATLTASLLGLIIKGGLPLVFVKSITAGACGLYLSPTLK